MTCLTAVPVSFNETGNDYSKQQSHWKAQFEIFYNLLTIFYNLLTAPQNVSNMYTLVAQAPLYANHVQNIQRISHGTCHVPCGTKGQLSYIVWQSLNCIYFSFILLAEPLTNDDKPQNVVVTIIRLILNTFIHECLRAFLCQSWPDHHMHIIIIEKHMKQNGHSIRWTSRY